MAPKIKLIYFDFKARAEAARLAFHIGGVEFEDVRVTSEQFVNEYKPKAPFGQLPLLEVDGKLYAQSDAILNYAGRVAGLYPHDSVVKALQVDSAVAVWEDLLAKLNPTFYMPADSEERKTLREKWANETSVPFFSGLNKMLEENGTGYYVGDKLTVADLKSYVFATWLASGVIDHIPKDLLDKYPAIKEHTHRMDTHPKIAEWNKAHQKK